MVAHAPDCDRRAPTRCGTGAPTSEEGNGRRPQDGRISAGDRHITWDPAAVAAGDGEATAAVREAERLFAAVRAQGGTAFTLGPSQTTTRIEHFDRTAEQI